MIPSIVVGVFGGFLFLFAAAITKEERWQVAYAIVGLILLLWSLGFFGFGNFTLNTLPPLAMVFGLFSVYAKGTAQLMSILITLIIVQYLIFP